MTKLMAGSLLFLFIAAQACFAVQVKEIDVTDNDIPSAFDGVRIAFVTDIHCGPYVSRAKVRKLAEQINGIHPDIVVYGGDYAYRGARYFAPCFEELRRVNAAGGTFGVFGNHDHWYGIDQARAGLAQAGIRSLENQGTWISRAGQRIRLCGVGDLWCGAPDIQAAIGDAVQDDFVILVSHNPDLVANLRDDAVDLVLSGHTHGGQIVFCGYAPFVPSAYGSTYRTGVINGKVTAIFSNGIGMIGLPFRLGAPAQIYVVRLKKR
jgi:predicted MPP superfamily phosphohydrolase